MLIDYIRLGRNSSITPEKGWRCWNGENKNCRRAKKSYFLRKTQRTNAWGKTLLASNLLRMQNWSKKRTSSSSSSQKSSMILMNCTSSIRRLRGITKSAMNIGWSCSIAIWSYSRNARMLRDSGMRLNSN